MNCLLIYSRMHLSLNSNYKTKNTDDKLADMCYASMVLATLLVNIFIICAFKLYSI